jgi:hypothetical protein
VEGIPLAVTIKVHQPINPKNKDKKTIKIKEQRQQNNTNQRTKTTKQ